MSPKDQPHMARHLSKVWRKHGPIAYCQAFDACAPFRSHELAFFAKGKGAS